MANIRPENLLISISSLASICSKKLSGENQIDNNDLLDFYLKILPEIKNYQEENNHLEISNVITKYPKVNTFETERNKFEKISKSVYYHVLLIFIIPSIFLLPFAGISLLFIWLITWVFVKIKCKSRQLEIDAQLRLIVELSDMTMFLIRDNEAIKKQQS
jgi:hypothetical protein